MLVDGEVVEEPRLVGKERQPALPLVGGCRPASARNVEVLPAPFGPTRPSTSPGFTEKVRSRTATKESYDLVRPETSMAFMRVDR
jgi:hypothetical protein